jgi:hypothetical protein
MDSETVMVVFGGKREREPLEVAKKPNILFDLEGLLSANGKRYSAPSKYKNIFKTKGIQ